MMIVTNSKVLQQYSKSIIPGHEHLWMLGSTGDSICSSVTQKQRMVFLYSNFLYYTIYLEVVKALQNLCNSLCLSASPRDFLVGLFYWQVKILG